MNKQSSDKNTHTQISVYVQGNSSMALTLMPPYKNEKGGIF